jgi:hypothetical protein
MASELAQAHIVSQARLRTLTAAAAATIWQQLPGYDEEHVDEWLTRVLPIIAAGQRQSVRLTEAFLSRALGRAPLGVQADEIIGAAARAGTDPATVYRRPFVTVWTALGAGKDWNSAAAAGLARARSTAATDVQLAMRGTLTAVGEADDLIVGYARVPDGGACDFCRLVAGQRYRTDQLMPIHSHCGCGVDVITRQTRGNFTGNADNDLTVTRDDGLTAAVREHGELGPVLVNGDHDFTQL